MAGLFGLSGPVGILLFNFVAKKFEHRIYLPCWIRVHHTARRIADWVGIPISQALRNHGETQRRVLKCGTEMTMFSTRSGNQRSNTGKLGHEVQNQLADVKLSHHILQVSSTQNTVKVFANVRPKMNRPEDDQMALDQKVNVLIWVLFMSPTMKAAIHLGENYNENLFTYKNTNFKALKTLFDITQKLILNQKHEIRHVSTIDWQFTRWMKSTLQHDRVIKLWKAKVHINSDSVRCLGKLHSHPEIMVKWKRQLQYFQSSYEYR